MQYILTQDEYKNLVPKNKYDNKCEEVEKLNNLVLKVAKFECIHDRTIEDDDEDEYYCDNCPLVDVGTCSRNKNFSQ